ncbi:MAG: hypothetical protein AAF541_08870, partial [Pseudomonadota bacterium]
PTGPLLGGTLTEGELISTPIENWSFVTEPEIEMQLSADTTSRHTWLIAMGNRAYMPAGTTFPPNKSWHIRAEQNGAAVLRILGQRYPVTLSRIAKNSDEFASVAQHMQQQGTVPPGGSDAMWLFSVISRPIE